MNLSDIGEFGLIRRFSPPFIRDLPSSLKGIGDDCAVIPQDDSRSLMITTDMLVEEIHFLRDHMSPEDLGYKSLAVNLSDIAAMGGTPGSAFLSIAIPPDLQVEWLDSFFMGVHELAADSNVYLMGGDTTRSPGPFVINIAVIGTAHPSAILYRANAKPGDVVCVTDVLGASAGGLLMLLENREIDDDDSRSVFRQHVRPRPHLQEGQWLATQTGPTAMIDVSDGIDSDLHRIMEAADVGARVEVDRIPVDPHLKPLSDRYGWSAEEIAATGGEDYCLLVTIHPDHYDRVAKAFQAQFGRPLVSIGTITEDAQQILKYEREGMPISFAKHRFNHFGSSEKE